MISFCHLVPKVGNDGPCLKIAALQLFSHPVASVFCSELTTKWKWTIFATHFSEKAAMAFQDRFSLNDFLLAIDIFNAALNRGYMHN